MQRYLPLFLALVHSPSSPGCADCSSARRLPGPSGHKSFCKHDVFDTCGREAPIVATAWVQPVVHPMAPCGDFPGSLWVRAVDVFGSMPDTLFRQYINVFLADAKLPEEVWQLMECGECGRKSWEDPMALA